MTTSHERHVVSNHQSFNCLFNSLYKPTSKSALQVLCEGNSPVTGEFPTQRTSNVAKASIWWHHHDLNQTIFIHKNYFQNVVCRMVAISFQLPYVPQQQLPPVCLATSYMVLHWYWWPLSWLEVFGFTASSGLNDREQMLTGKINSLIP